MCQSLNAEVRKVVSAPELLPLEAENKEPSARDRSGRSGPRHGAVRGRRRLWDIGHKYHCPIIGTCLDADDLRRLAAKVDAVALKDAKSDFDLHVRFVAASDEKNALSLAVQKELERRYGRFVKRFAAARSPDALRALWQAALADGEVQGAFWALMTHGLADVETCSRAYEDVHMLSHQIGAGLRADLAALAKTRKELARLRNETDAAAKQQARRLQAKIKEVSQLREQLASLQGIEQAYDAMRARLRELEDDRELRALRARVAELEDASALQRRRLADAEQRATALAQSVEAAEAEISGLRAQLGEQINACEALERLVVTGGDDSDSCTAEDCEACIEQNDRGGGLDLGGRRILCVGGRSDLAARYRDLARRCNGELIRHDGGLEDSQQRLDALLASADAVICPIDAVSHNAYARTKRFCKRMAKPCVLVPRSSIGAFAQALSALAGPAGQALLQGPVRLGGECLSAARRAH